MAPVGTDYLQRGIYGNELADRNQSGAFYYTGIGLGVIGTIASGYGAAGLLKAAGTGTQVSRSALVTARGLQAYAVVGDVVGVAQSSYSAYNGTFSAFDTLGFAPTIG